MCSAREVTNVGRALPLAEILAVRVRIGVMDIHFAKRSKRFKWKAGVHHIPGADPALLALKKDIDAFLRTANRPKKLRVFINPFGGKRKAAQNMAKVRPLFTLANVSSKFFLSFILGGVGRDCDHARTASGQLGEYCQKFG